MNLAVINKGSFRQRAGSSRGRLHLNRGLWASAGKVKRTLIVPGS